MTAGVLPLVAVLLAAGCDGGDDGGADAGPDGGDNGVACTSDASCASGLCVDSVCCEAACDGPCDTCALGGAEGRCVVLPDGSQGSPSCAPYTCGGASAACETACDDDDDCVGASVTCVDGACVGPAPLGEVCGDGGDCASGFCVDGRCCRVPDCGGDGCSRCDGAGTAGTCTPAVGRACDDGQFCNGADTCNRAGLCAVHTGSPCPGPDGDSDCSESCNEATDDCSADDGDGATCDNGFFCDGADTCSGGTCSVHAGSPCPGGDGDGDCSESCNEANDDCSANDPNGSTCSDGAFCTLEDSCFNGACIQSVGSPCPGPDNDADCSESCDEANDTCTANDPNGSTCSDGTFCNGSDTCSGGVCSVHSGDPCPGPDGDGDCSETCSEANDACTLNDPNGSPCDNGGGLGGDTCSSGVCLEP